MAASLLRSVFVAGVLVSLPIGVSLAEKQYGPGVTDTEIKIGQTMPYSGPVSLNSPTGKAMTAYFKKINDEGGVNGRRVNLISLDDGYSPPRTMEQTRRLVEDEGVLIIFGSLGTPTNLATRRYLNGRGVPQLFITTGVTKFGDPKSYPWTMGFMPNFATEAAAYAAYLLQHRPDAKVGVLYQNDDYGKDLVNGLKTALGDKAARMIVAESTYEVTDPTVDQQIITLKSSGADVLMNFSTPKAGAQAVRKVYEIDWHPLHFLASPANSISTTLKPVGLEKAVGLLSATSSKDPSDPQWASDPGVQSYLAFMKRYYPEADPADPNALRGYEEAMALVEVLKRCGDDLTRENVMRQATSLSAVQLPTLLPGITVNTSATNYFPISRVQLERFDGSRWARISQ
ncbi:MAG TPA: ABC transporter substrate-binding protein [Burkholderiales bacterium]|nr:ABC transporter substrate-binding protein [Burkholderiales bacterium]